MTHASGEDEDKAFYDFGFTPSEPTAFTGLETRDYHQTSTRVWLASFAARLGGGVLLLAATGAGVAALISSSSIHTAAYIATAGSAGILLADKTEAAAVWLRGREALRTFDAYQAEAALRSDLEPFKVHLDVDDNNATIAQLVDKDNSLYLVRKAGAECFEVVGKRGFERLRDEVALAGGEFNLVLVQDANDTAPANVTIARYHGGRQHGSTIERPAVVVCYQDGLVHHEYFDHGQHLEMPQTKPLVAGQFSIQDCVSTSMPVMEFGGVEVDNCTSTPIDELHHRLY